MTASTRQRADNSRAIKPWQWQPGQSGNPKGRAPGSRNKLAQDFVADLHESWKTLGKAAIMAMAWTDPGAYVRVVASLVPKDIEVTVTNVHLDRMATNEIEALIRAEADGAEDPLDATPDAEKVFRVD